MSHDEHARSPYECIEQKINVFREEQLCEPRSNWPIDVKIFMRHINDNIFTNSTYIQDIKKECGINNNNISSKFKYYVEYTPKEYIINKRLKLAKDLLTVKSINISDVALAIGYDSPNGFTMMFKRKEGMTPSTFRKKLVKRGQMQK